jgi:hypothetical protein
MRSSSTDSLSAWAGAGEFFLDALLLLRDIFVFALPGGLFFAIGLASHRLTLAQVNFFLAPYHPPTWALGLLLIAVCYLVGHLLFAIAGLRVEFWKLVHWSDPDWLADYPTEVTARDLVIRHYFPDLFREMERREARARFMLSSIAALLAGWLIFFVFRPRFADVMIWTAVLVFLDTLTSMSRLGRVRKAIHAAGQEIEDREKAVSNAEAAIQPNGDELRFVVDSIFKAAELTSPKQHSLELKPPESEAQATRPASADPAAAQPSAHEAVPSSFGTPRL